MENNVERSSRDLLWDDILSGLTKENTENLCHCN
jgi:hypothetical protein